MSIVIRLRYVEPKNRSSIPDRIMRFFCSPKRSDKFWSQLSHVVIGYWGLFLGKGVQIRRGADHSPPISEEFKNEWNSAPTPTCLRDFHRGKFTLHITLPL
jgi:hypothetical protein